MEYEQSSELMAFVQPVPIVSLVLEGVLSKLYHLSLTRTCSAI
jgi:hypothetical protein